MPSLSIATAGAADSARSAFEQPMAAFAARNQQGHTARRAGAGRYATVQGVPCDHHPEALRMAPRPGDDDLEAAVP